MLIIIPIAFYSPYLIDKIKLKHIWNSQNTIADICHSFIALFPKSFNVLFYFMIEIKVKINPRNIGRKNKPKLKLKLEINSDL